MHINAPHIEIIFYFFYKLLNLNGVNQLLKCILENSL